MGKGIKSTVKIDEQELNDMIAHDVRQYRRSDVQSNEKNAPTQKLLDLKEYEDIFLKRPPTRERKGTYISLKHFELLSDILSVIAPRLSVPYFLDNLIKDHLEKYKKEMKELYNCHIENIKKRYDFLK